MQSHQHCRHDEHDQGGERRALLCDSEKLGENRLAEKRLDERVCTLRRADELRTIKNKLKMNETCIEQPLIDIY